MLDRARVPSHSKPILAGNVNSYAIVSDPETNRPLYLSERCLSGRSQCSRVLPSICYTGQIHDRNSWNSWGRTAASDAPALRIRLSPFFFFRRSSTRIDDTWNLRTEGWIGMRQGRMDIDDKGVGWVANQSKPRELSINRKLQSICCSSRFPNIIHADRPLL